MPRGRKTALTIYLMPAQRQRLLAWQRATTVPAGVARRCRIILLLADGVTITDIAAKVGISRQKVYKWTGYCWRTQKCRHLCVPHTFFEGKKVGKTSLRKGTPRTLK